MNIKRESRIEQKLMISEMDIVNNEELLIATAFAIKLDDELWSYPQTQVFNTEVYERNKEQYQQEIMKFRRNVEGDVDVL